MPHAFVLVMLVQSSEATDPSLDATIDAAHRTLGGDARVKVAPYSEPPSDDTIRRYSQGADAVVVVSFSDGHQHVRLRMLRTSDGAFVDRDIGFDARDASRERGRTIGFALASMLPEIDDNANVHAGETTPSTAPTVALDTPAPPRPPPPRVFRGAVSAVGLAATGVGGYGGGGGGAIDVEWYANRWLGLQAVVSARSADVGPVAATSYVVTAGGGARARVIRRSAFELGAKADFVLLWEELVHLDADDHGPRQLSHLLPAAIGALDFTWYFAEAAGLTLAGGSEIAFGQTDLYLRGQKSATLVPVRVFGDAGFRVRF